MRVCRACLAGAPDWMCSCDREEFARDSDGSPKGRDAKRLDGEAATARAEGIAQQPHPKV